MKFAPDTELTGTRMSDRKRVTVSLLRRLGEEKVVLPIGGWLSVSLLEIQAVLFFISGQQ